MNTKLSFVLLIAAIIVTACTPLIAGGSAPMDPAQPTGNDTAAVVPVTGVSAPVPSQSSSQEPRLWSGAVSDSDNGNPDYVQNADAPTPTVQNLQDTCMSEDSLPKRQGGCIE